MLPREGLLAVFGTDAEEFALEVEEKDDIFNKDTTGHNINIDWLCPIKSNIGFICFSI